MSSSLVDFSKVFDFGLGAGTHQHHGEAADLAGWGSYGSRCVEDGGEAHDLYPGRIETPFRYIWQWNGEETEIMSRAIDETGYIQPTFRQLSDARGGSKGGYHFNPITAWRVRRTGEVLLQPEVGRR